MLSSMQARQYHKLQYQQDSKIELNGTISMEVMRPMTLDRVRQHIGSSMILEDHYLNYLNLITIAATMLTSLNLASIHVMTFASAGSTSLVPKLA